MHYAKTISAYLNIYDMLVAQMTEFNSLELDDLLVAKSDDIESSKRYLDGG